MDVYKKAGTAQVLRLTKPWHGTGRAVYADSAFASVTTAIACRQKGLHFTGLVKTATTKFLKKLISTIPGIIETDAYLMWKHFHPDGRNWNHASFTEELAMQLLSIPEDETSPNVSLDSSADVITLKGHEICPMSELEQYKSQTSSRAPLRRCRICGGGCKYYCKGCSSQDNNILVPLCGLKSKNESACIMKHIQL